MCGHLCVQVHMCVQVRGQPWISCPKCCLPCFLVTRSLTGMGLTKKARVVGQSAPGIPDCLVSALPVVEIEKCATMPEFLCGCSGPHASVTDILLTGLYP